MNNEQCIAIHVFCSNINDRAITLRQEAIVPPLDDPNDGVTWRCKPNDCHYAVACTKLVPYRHF